MTGEWHDPKVQDRAALDYAEQALSECWIVLRDIAAGHKYPARYAANLLQAHGHNLDGGGTEADVLRSVRDAHDWGCDCTPDDPCRILIALNGGPSRPQR